MGSTITAVTQDNQLVQFTIDDEGKESNLQTFDPQVPGARMALMALGFIPDNIETIAAHIVNGGRQEQMLQAIADMCNISMSFDSHGTLVVKDVAFPDTLMTQSMGHRLATTVKNDNWHKYSVTVKRAEGGIVFGEESFEDMGKPQ